MSNKRMFYVLLGVLGFVGLIIILATFYGAKALEKQATSLTALKLDTRLLQEQQESLVRANQDLIQYADLEKNAKAIVPADKDQARTVREIVRLAQSSGITISSISFPTSQLGAVPKAVKPSATQTTETTKKTEEPTTSVSQVVPVTGIPGVFQLELTATTSGDVSYDSVIGFLKKLEKNRRTAHVSEISIQPSEENPSLVIFEFKATVFVKP